MDSGDINISIVVPVFNSEKTLKECLDALVALDEKPHEIILVNDCSTDNSVSICRNYDAQFIEMDQKSGAAKVRNVGAAKATGELLLFIDSDIVLPPDTLQKITEYYQAGHEVFIGMFLFQLRYKSVLSNYKHLYLCHNYLSQGSQTSTLDTSLTVITKKLFDGFKGFDERLGYMSEDAEFGNRLTRAGVVITQPKHICMEHLKEYSFLGFVRSELLRGEKFSRLFVNSFFKDKKDKTKKNLSGKSYYLKPFYIYFDVAFMPFILMMALIALLTQLSFAVTLFFLMLTLFVVINFPFWSFLAKHRGLFFSLKAVFVTIFDVIIFDVGIGITFVKMGFKPRVLSFPQKRESI